LQDGRLKLSSRICQVLGQLLRNKKRNNQGLLAKMQQQRNISHLAQQNAMIAVANFLSPEKKK
jgi:hypothetical protein